jgi:hypothetical protein
MCALRLRRDRPAPVAFTRAGGHHGRSAVEIGADTRSSSVQARVGIAG